MTESTTSRPEADQDQSDTTASLDPLDAPPAQAELSSQVPEPSADETEPSSWVPEPSTVEPVDEHQAEDSATSVVVTEGPDDSHPGAEDVALAEDRVPGASETDESDADERDDEAVGESDDEEDDDAAPKPSKGSRAKQLEREGEVAADFLETLLDIADLDGDLEVDIDGDRAAVSIVDSEEGRVPRRLVGPQGKVLEALQELTRLAVQTATGERSRLMLDVAGHRAERRSTLVELAKVAIAEVKESGQKKALDDMTAFERKVIHDEVAGAGLDSESEGVEPHRHIVILPV